MGICQFASLNDFQAVISYQSYWDVTCRYWISIDLNLRLGKKTLFYTVKKKSKIALCTRTHK